MTTSKRFQNFKCWDEDQLPLIMDTEAIQVSDQAFAATHTPPTMRVIEGDAVNGEEINEQQVLERFTQDYDEDYVFLLVKGFAGTGKSHLIRWLHTQIEETKDRRVVFVPKVGTNLKGIIELILQGMEGPEFDEFRRNLKGSDGINEEEAPGVLLDFLSRALTPEAIPFVRGWDPEQGDEQGQRQKISRANYLVGYDESGNAGPPRLRDLLQDPYFNHYLLSDPNSKIRQIAKHVIGSKDQIDRLDDVPRFDFEDLPSNRADYAKASDEARETYIHIDNNPTSKSVALELLNRQLDTAIQRLLGMTGQDYTRMMSAIRVELAKSGRQLVLLIEDFSILRGLEMDVLESALVRPRQLGSEEHCGLRVAIAATTNYADNMMDTIIQRIQNRSFIVDMDVRGSMTPADVSDVASRYLNAVRYPKQQLESWFAESERGEDRQPLPSYCDQCSYKGPCHKAFGQSEGRGLYPFNETSINRMTARRLPAGANLDFSPRTLVNGVLRHTLGNYGADIERGVFPTAGLKNSFFQQDSETIRAEDLQTIQTRFGRDRERVAQIETLAELWTPDLKPDSISTELADAFGINLGALPPPPPPPPPPPHGTGDPPPPPPRTLGLSENLKSNLDALDRWAQGPEQENQISQILKRNLSDLLHSNISQVMDWDRLGYRRSFFAGNAGNVAGFHPTSINCLPQATSTPPRNIMVNLPLEESQRAETAVALKGLLSFDEVNHWGFEGGAKQLETFSRMLDIWAEYVTNQFDQTTMDDPSESWDPLPATVELLCLGNIIAIGPSSLNQSPELFDSVCKFDPELAQAKSEGFSSEWEILRTVYLEHQSDLLTILNSRGFCLQNGAGNAGGRFINAGKIAKTLERLISNQKPSEFIPDVNLKQAYQAISDLRSTFDEFLSSAIDGELRETKMRINFIRETLGSLIDQDELVLSLQRVVGQAQTVGVLRPNGIASRLSEKTELFADLSIESVIMQLEEGLKTDNRIELMSALASEDKKHLDDIHDFAKSCKEFLTETEKTVIDQRGDIPSKKSIELQKTQIDKQLSTSIEWLESLDKHEET